MITMNEPQVWTLIGVFATLMTGMMVVITQSFHRSIAGVSEKVDSLGREIGSKFETVNDRIDGMKTEMLLRFEQVDRGFEQVDRRFEQVDQRFEQVDRRFEKVEARIEAIDGRLLKIEKRVDDIDRDVQAISKNVFPE